MCQDQAAIATIPIIKRTTKNATQVSVFCAKLQNNINNKKPRQSTGPWKNWILKHCTAQNDQSGTWKWSNFLPSFFCLHPQNEKLCNRTDLRSRFQPRFLSLWFKTYFTWGPSFPTVQLSSLDRNDLSTSEVIQWMINNKFWRPASWLQVKENKGCRSAKITFSWK